MADDRTTIIESPSRSSGPGWIIAALLVVAVIVGVVFLMQTSGSETAKDNAIANAATNVGEAAKDVGSAAEKGAENATK